MRSLSPNAQLISDIFDEIAKGNGTPFWEGGLKSEVQHLIA